MKKDILISVYNMEIGGIERSLINMLESFDYEKYNVDLLIFEHTGDLLSYIPEKVNILPQIDKYSVFRKSIIQCLKEGYYKLSLIRLISKYIAILKSMFKKWNEGSGYYQMQLVQKYSSYFMPKIEKKYDLAISYAWPHNILAKKVDAEKKIAWVHTDYSKLEIDNNIDLHIWNKFDYIGSVSDACTESFLINYPTLKNKIISIENINSPEFIKKMSKSKNEFVETRNRAEFNIVSVGRLSYVKGFDMAISAMKVLHNKGFTNIKWYVIGYGGYEIQLKELITKNNLEDYFILLGKKVNPYPYIKAGDIFVQPSRYEGKAVTVTEAKILEKPILITDYPTARSQVTDGLDGIICDLSVEGIVNGIEMLYENQTLRDKLINNLKKKNFSNSNELNKIYEIVEEKSLKKINII